MKTYFVIRLEHKHVLTDDQITSFKNGLYLTCPISYDDYQYDYHVYKGEFPSHGPGGKWVELFRKSEEEDWT